jgi:methylated-DNA-protein-cysteine methyltransferase-like protein
MKFEEKEEDFYTKVYKIAGSIPSGKVTTYGKIAEAAGMKSSARMVGWALNKTKGSSIPAHRVVNRNGELTGKLHFATPSMMKDMLISEGVTFKGEAVDLAEHLWEPK